MKWYIKVLANYVGFGFDGRARRKEFWMFTLVNVLIEACIYILAVTSQEDGTTILFCSYYIAILLPSMAVAVRRLHDINKSGWWILLNLIPVVGSVCLLVMACIKGDQGDNEYGPDPKANEA